ncbi:MAG: hypothetical protein WA102_14340 [Candidatus Methanoperedens sp.]
MSTSSAGTVNYFNVNSGDISIESLTSSLSGTVGTQSISPGTTTGTYAYPLKFERVAFNQSTNISGRWNFSVHFMVGAAKTVTGAPYAKIYKYEDGTETLLYNGSADKPTDKSFANVNTEFNWSQNLSNVIIGANAKIRVEILFVATTLPGGFSSTIDLKYGTSTYDSQAEITNKSAPAGVLSGTSKNTAPLQAKIGEKEEKMMNFTLSSSSAGYVDIGAITVRLTGASTNQSIRFIKLLRDDNKNYEVDPTDTELGIKEFNGSKFAKFGTAGLVLDSLAASSSNNYFIEYDIATMVGTSVGETVGARIESGDITISLGSFGTMNYPYNSTNVTIIDQPPEEAANIYGFLNKPVYLFGNYSGGAYTAGGGEDAAKPAVDDNVIWPGSAANTVLGVSTWKTAANQEYMIESTTIRAMLYVTDGRGRSKAGQRVNAWIINNLGQKINNSNVTDSQGRTTIEFWGWPDWGSSTTSAKAWPTHSGQNITVDGTSTTQEAQYIYAKFKSREYYYVYVDYDSDNIADYEMPFLAYTMYDTFPWPDKLVAHCESNDREAHDHQGNDFAHRAAGTDNDPVCADCHGWSKDAGPSPISVSVDPRPLIKYSTTHPFPKSSKALDCTESNCHPGYNDVTQPIPGWADQTHIIKDESYPNTSVCSTSGCHTSGGRALPYVDSITPRNDEGHCLINDIPGSTKGVGCKYCHNYNFHFQKEREKIPAFVLIPEDKTNNDGNYPGTCFQGCHITVAWHNNTVACQECHFNLSKAPMHQSNLKVDRKQCYQSCHGNYSLAQVKSKDNVTYLSMSRVWLNTTWRHSTESNNGSKWNTSIFNKNNYTGKSYWNNSGSDFPQDACEFCHSNEHTGAVFVVKHPMGKLFQFNGYNILNSQISHTSNWCSGCHWQGYKQNGTITWNDMFKAFNDTSLPIPPEISGNVTHAPINGSNSGQNGVTAYVNHSAWFMNNGTGSDYSDAMCFDCHANGIKITDGHKMFQHNVTIGFGGPECSACHNSTMKGITEPNGIVRLDSPAIENTSWVHFNLSNRTGADKSQVRSIEASCWGCHNTSGGRPDPSEHPTSYKQPRNCTNCHVYGNYSAPIIVEHMPGGYNPSSDIKLRTPSDYCTRCHNNSLLAYSSLNTTNFTSNANATVGHYATNKTLMTATNTSKDCTWCHFSNSNNVNWSTPVDPRTNYSLHTGKVNNDCYGCHVVGGATTVNSAGWSFHDASVKLGASGGVNCTNCHNSGTENKVNFTAVSMSMHATLNSGAQSTPANASNKPCWACHGTVNATSKLANESDQPVGNHTDTGITTYKNPKKCYDCHITGSLNFTTKNVTDHIPSGYTASTDVNTSSYNYTYCSYCHNNSVNSGYEPDSMGLTGSSSPMNASVSHYGANKTAGKLMYNSTGNTEDCVYCHRNSSNMVKWGILPGSLANISNKNSSGGGSSHDDYTTSDQCGTCHGSYVDTAGFTFHNAAIGNGSGGGSGPNCKTCHNISDSSTGRGHVDYTAFNTSIHGGINTTSGADNDPDNEPCWACHGDGTKPSAHPANYKSPYICADCHVSTGVRYAWATGKGALNVSEHFTNGTKIKASYNATATFSCLKCHQDKGEMLLPNGDTDYNKTTWTQGGDNYNATIGGNNSPYHYGAKRTTLNGSAQNTDGYCNYCHSNSSSIFPYVNQHNKSIFEHTANTSADIKNTTSLNCNNPVCHGTGRIHNASLNKTVQTAWTSGQKDYCAPCHKPKPTGLANKSVYGQWHDPANSSSDNMTNCNYCHDSGSLGSTALSYSLNVHSDNLTYPIGTTTCVACHNTSSTYVKGRKILTHFPGASKDKGNTSLSGRTCELCHGIAGQSMHASGLVKKPNYGCADCHVPTGAGPYWANQSFNSYIDTTSHDNASTSNVTNCVWCHNNSGAQASLHFTEWANGSAAAPGWGGWQAGKPVNCTDCHDSSNSNKMPFYAPAKPHAGTGNNTDECYSCHTSVNTYNAAPLAVHSVAQSPGNANCTKCHDIGGAASKEVDVAAMNRSDSIHLNLNSGASSGNATSPFAADSKRCWACHGDGTGKNEHDQTRYKNPYKCEDCHTSGGSQSGKYVSLNVTEHFAGGTDIKTANASYCNNCHNKGEMLQGHNDADVLSANASVGHYGKKRGADMRTGVNTTCTYCHQNSTTAFESVMLKSSNKSIIEHTTSSSANVKNTSLTCNNDNCHKQGFIHNATLTKPVVQIWTSGKFDYCAPCHKAGNANATKYVYGHNSSNISVVSTDCGYCHNSSSQGQPGGTLKIHTPTLTNMSVTNTSCVTCHQNATYVSTQRVINTHYPEAPAGKANTSQDSLTCEACHGNMLANKMHAPVSIPADRCNNCHNGTASGTYKATKIPYVNVTKHDNSSHNVSNNINCDWCHNNSNAIQKFHFTQYPNGTVQAPGWAGWINGTNANCTNCHGTYNQTKPFYAEPIWHKGNYGTTADNCYQCHTSASSSTGGSAPIALHNVTKAIDWSYCNNCHSNSNGGAPKVDNASLASGMHATLNGSTPSNTEPACKACHGGNSTVHKNATANNCTYCHITGSTLYGAKNVSRHIPYPYTTDVNTSRYQNVFCSDCHNNSLGTFDDPTQSTRNATTSHYGMNKTAGKLMYNTSGNTEDCVYCHRNSSNMAAWGILGTSKANLSKKGGGHATATNSDCYTCHINSTSAPVTFHVEDVSAGAGGGPDCKACHNFGGNAQGKIVNFSAMNDSLAIHRNLNSGATAVVDAENKKCWACHTTNGTAPQAGNHTLVDRYKNPYNCTDCHISKAGQNLNFTPKAILNVTQHKLDTVNGTTIFTPQASDCYSCHNISEMMIQAYDPDSGTGAVYGGLHGGNDSVSHYGSTRSLGTGDAYCNYCHSNLSSPFYLSSHNMSITEHTANPLANISNATTLRCVDCHKSGRIHDASLNKTPQNAWTSGQKDYCAPCHKPKPTGQANKSVYLQGHDPTYSSSDRIGDCGFCHNASSQGVNGSSLKIHSETLTNRSTTANSTTCQGCHNGTAVYTGAAKQILSHMPNGSQYRGNTSASSYNCELCHNMTGKSSMHSAGMNRSNGNCDTCHFNNTSPFRSLTKNITQLAGGMVNHTYNGAQKYTCNTTACHNASGRVRFHLSKYASGDIADPQDSNGNPTFPLRATSDPNDRGILVDCMDCHETYNDTAPFNAPFFEANGTGVNNQEHVGKGYTLNNCYVCHTFEDNVSKPVTMHNVSIEPLSGGPNCTKCHNIGATVSGKAPDDMLVNFTAFNSTNSSHRNLANATAWGGSSVFGLIDTACWACHQSDGKQMERHPDLKDDTSSTGGSIAYRCADCHTLGGNVSSKQPSVFQNATKIYKHYPGSIFYNNIVFNQTKYCSGCHKNSIVADINISGYSSNLDADATNVSHYGDRSGLLVTNETKNGCKECHGGKPIAKDYGNPVAMPLNHSRMGGSPVDCQVSCHNSNPAVNITLHEIKLGIYLGTGGCFGSSPCHQQSSTGTKKKR